MSLETRPATSWAPLRTGSAGETEALGAALGPALCAGDVLVLSGPLGSGKTCFVTGLARGMGAAARVRSPSFTLLNEYAARPPLLHLDLYRLTEAEALDLGIEDRLEGAAMVAEWGERLPASLREEALTLRFEIAGPASRTLTALASRGRGLELLQAWGALADARSRPTGEP